MFHPFSHEQWGLWWSKLVPKHPFLKKSKPGKEKFFVESVKKIHRILRDKTNSPTELNTQKTRQNKFPKQTSIRFNSTCVRSSPCVPGAKLSSKCLQPPCWMPRGKLRQVHSRRAELLWSAPVPSTMPAVPAPPPPQSPGTLQGFSGAECPLPARKRPSANSTWRDNSPITWQWPGLSCMVKVQPRSPKAIRKPHKAA